MAKSYALVLLVLLFNLTADSQVVINEVYGGGGNTGSVYKNDFIELYNNGTAAVSLAGWSVQYASSTGGTWQVTNLSGSIAPNGYYLIQQAAGTGGTTALPSPDATGTLALSATTGKVALVNSTVALTGSCPTGFVDFVGFGTANCYEGTAVAPAPSNTTSIQRSPVGADTQDNAADFKTGSPSPTNGSGADVTPPAIASLSPANGATGVATSFVAALTFNESIVKGTAGNILIKQATDNFIVATIDVLNSSTTIAGATLSFPVNGLALNTGYYVEVAAGAVKDLASNNFAGITGGSTWAFTTTATAPAGALNFTYTFSNCSSTGTDGFSNYSVTGAEVWGCTTFGRDPANPAGTAAFESAVQINGFSGGTNVLNEDWFISPAFDLTTTAYPLLSFWGRTAFNGQPLQLKVSVDFPGTGNPALYTWTDINGRFPAQTSNIWTQSQGIDLSAFKSAKTYFAFVYNSTADDGARWTLDDIRIDNSSTPPPPSLTLNTSDVQFGYVPVSTAGVKNMVITGNNLTGNLGLVATGNFLISKTNSNFTSSVSYTQAEANNMADTLFIQFLPTQSGLNYSGNITISTPGVADTTVNLKGNSIDAALTLEAVNWNLEWFGSADPTLGPTDKTLQQNNVEAITQNIGADIFAFAEVVSETNLQNVVANLNTVYGAGTYAYVICNYGSHTNPFESGAGPVAAAQKEAFVYKTSVINPIETPGALVSDGPNTAADLANPAYNYFSSGRYPFMLYANVTLGNVTKPVRFVLLHAKANTSPTTTSYNRRKAGADTLNYTLNNLYPNDNIVLLGDFNDDLDQSITAGFTTSSYSTFNNDGADFFSPTLALSLAGKKSTVSYNDMIDHVELSNEMRVFYMQNSASVLSDVSSLVSNYGSTTSDHYPVFTRYAFDATILPVNLVSFTATKQSGAVTLNWSTSQEQNSQFFIVERSADSRAWQPIGTINAAGNSNTTKKYMLTDNSPASGINYYRLKQVDINGAARYSVVKTVVFNTAPEIKIAPNPSHNSVKLSLPLTGEKFTVEIIDITGKSLWQKVTSGTVLQINTANFVKGNYIIKVHNGKDLFTQKLVLQ